MDQRNLRGVNDWFGVCDPKQGIAGKQRGGEAEQSACEADAASSGAGGLQSQHTEDALGEWPAVGGHGEGGRTSPFFHHGEGAGVLDRIAAELDGHIVAAVLALGADAVVQPPHGRVVKEQSLHRNLENIDEGIETLDVRQFVGNHSLQLLLGKPGEGSHRQQHDGTEPANHRRRLQPLALAVTDGSFQAQAMLQGPANRKHSSARGGGLFAALAFEQKESAGGTKTEERHSKQPRFHQPGQSVERRREAGNSERCFHYGITGDPRLRPSARIL